MKNLFLVTSAINTQYGKSEERLLQTIHTVDSIRSKDPNAEVWLIESSLQPVAHYMKSLIDARFISFSSDKRISEISETSQGSEETNGFIKNRTESYVMLNTLRKYKEEISKFDRVYKISGRYFVSVDFNTEDHNHPSCITIKEPFPSPFKNPLPITGSEYRHRCILYSFCTSILDEVISMMALVNDDIESYFNEYKLGKLKYCDIEHSLYKNMIKDKVKYINRTGVIGRIGDKEGQIHRD